jgi:hypothetical protein
MAREAHAVVHAVVERTGTQIAYNGTTFLVRNSLRALALASVGEPPDQARGGGRSACGARHAFCSRCRAEVT